MAEISTLARRENRPRFLATVLIGYTLVILALLPLFINYPLHMVAVMAGIPVAAMVLHNKLRNTALVLLFALVPFVGILKAVTGSRYAPLTFDLSIGLGCLVGLAILAQKKRLRVGLLDIFLLLFLMLAFLAMFNPNVPSLVAGIEGFRKFAFAAIAFWVGRHLFTQKHLRLLQTLMLFASALIALYGIKQFFYMSELDWRLVDLASANRVTYMMGGQIRPFSTLPGPFHLGVYLVIAGLLVLSQLYALRQRPTRRFWFLILLAIQVFTLFLTRTKANWFAIVAGAAIILILLSGFRLKAILRIVGIGIVGLSVIMITLRFSSGTGNKVLTDAINAFINPSEAPTFVFRMELWTQEMLPAIRDQFLTGYGTSSAGEGLGFYYTGTQSQFFSSHNLYLKIILELGIFGLLLFGAIVSLSLLLGWRKFRLLRHNRDPLLQHHLWAIGVICAFLITGLTGAMLDAYPANYFFWLLLGSITAPLSRLKNDH